MAHRPTAHAGGAASLGICGLEYLAFDLANNRKDCIEAAVPAGRVWPGTGKSCKGPGVYKFSRPDRNTLSFVLVSDTCKPRIQNVTGTHHRK